MRRTMETDGVDEPVERFRALYEAHYGDVLAYCRRRAPDVAEDAVAETFTVAWRRLDDVPPGHEARLWLYGTARRVLANQHRSGRRADRLHLRLVRAARPAAEWPADEIDRSDVEPVMAALSTLKPDDQEVLRLVAWEELSHADAAVVLGCSVNAVAIRVHRARERLEEAIRQDRPKGAGPPGHVSGEGTTRKEDDR